MAEAFLENEAFLTQLSRLLDKAKTTGTFYLNMKRMGIAKTLPRSARKATVKAANEKPSALEQMKASIDKPAVEDEQSYACIVRAVVKKSKLGTIVHAADFEKFQTSYANLMRLHMDALKKKDRKARKKVAKKKTTSGTKPAATS